MFNHIKDDILPLTIVLLALLCVGFIFYQATMNIIDFPSLDEQTTKLKIHSKAYKATFEKKDLSMIELIRLHNALYRGNRENDYYTFPDNHIMKNK